MENLFNPDDETNYRYIRAISWYHIISGGCAIGISIAIPVSIYQNAPENITIGVALGFGFLLVGLAGVVGGIAALNGNRNGARLMYLKSAVNLIGFPIGTLLAVIVFRGLSRYLDTFERKAIEARALKPDLYVL